MPLPDHVAQIVADILVGQKVDDLRAHPQGLGDRTAEVDVDALTDRIEGIKDHLKANTTQLLTSQGVELLHGSARLVGPNEVEVVTAAGRRVIEADAVLIMDEENSAPRLLSRPGEGIYNDAAGAKAGNSPFQVVWLAEEIRERVLEDLRERAGDRWPALSGRKKTSRSLGPAREVRRVLNGSAGACAQCGSLV